MAHVASHADTFAGLRVQGDDSFMVVVVDVDQVADHGLAQLRHWRQKPPVAGLVAEALEAAQQQLLVRAVALADANARAVAQDDRCAEGHQLGS